LCCGAHSGGVGIDLARTSRKGLSKDFFDVIQHFQHFAGLIFGGASFMHVSAGLRSDSNDIL